MTIREQLLKGGWGRLAEFPTGQDGNHVTRTDVFSLLGQVSSTGEDLVQTPRGGTQQIPQVIIYNNSTQGFAWLSFGSVYHRTIPIKKSSIFSEFKNFFFSIKCQYMYLFLKKIHVTWSRIIL